MWRIMLWVWLGFGIVLGIQSGPTNPDDQATTVEPKSEFCCPDPPKCLDPPCPPEEI